jgi:hypothetical protein
MMKKLLIFTMAFLVSVAAVFSHEKGALALNIELLPLGLTIPQIKMNVPGAPKEDQLSLGIESGLRATVNYYFFPWISLNAGLAFGGIGDFALPVSTDVKTAYTAYVPVNSALSFGIPFGLRLNGQAFVVGAGLIAYFPFSSESEVGVATVSVAGAEAKTESRTDKSFSYKNFMGAYFDIGYDGSGKEGRKEGFGFLARLGFSFSDPIATSDWIDYQAYKHTTISIVINYSFAVAAFPIGGSE